MKGVILAAGDGGRMGSLTSNYPKILLPQYNKEPLIACPIQALAAAGITEIAIVVGYLANKVIMELGDGSRFGAKLQYIVNPDYLSGNAISVYKVREWSQGESLVLCMGDHLIEKKIFRHLLDIYTSNDTLCVDYTPAQCHQIDEATKVSVDDFGYIKDIGKGLVHWDALDAGVFLLTKDFFQAINELIRYRGTDIETADVIRFLINRGYCFNTCDVSGCMWMDIDTEEDLKVAKL